MADEEEFEDQLEQEKIAKVEEEEKESVHRGLTYTDTDGTVMEWDPAKRAYFPQIDNDFIARYQMNYGTDVSQAGSNQATTGAGDNSSTTAATADSTQAWNDYYYHYYYYQQGVAADTSADPASCSTDAKDEDQQNYTKADYYAYYSYYYGEDYAKKWLNAQEEEEEEEAAEEEEEAAEEEKSKEEEKNGKEEKKGKEKGDVKRKAPDEPPSWFDVDTEKSTHVYVSGLPSDLTDEEFNELMAKCGLIMFDPHTHKPKVKLYRNADGSLKGDGRCCYIKQESVDLALKILDGSNVHGSTISVERAKFELKGDFDPSKKKKKLSNKAKRKMKERQQKLFDWRPDLPPAARLRYERIVILKNMFDVKEFEDDPALINELREDVRSECSKFGEVRKVQVYDRHPAGVVSVMFRSPEEADVCVAALRGRWFAKKQIIAETYDGKTKYQVHETEEEKEERLRGWETFLETDSDSKKAQPEKKDRENNGQGQGESSIAGQGGAPGSDSATVAGSSSGAGADGASSDLTQSEGYPGNSGGSHSPAQPVQESDGGGAAN